MGKGSLKYRHLSVLALLVISLFICSDIYGAEGKVTYPMQLLFQELIFNVPQDSYFIIAFDPKSGKNQLIENVDYNKAITMFGQNIGSSKAFVLATSEDGFYKIIYKRLENGSYIYSLLSTRDNTYKEYNVQLLVADSKGYDYTNNRLELIECIYGNEKEKILAKEIDSFMKFPCNDTYFYTFKNGDLIKQEEFNKSANRILQRKRLITESGLITNNWGWYCERNNEKSKGYLKFINLSNYKIFNGSKRVNQSKLILVLTK